MNMKSHTSPFLLGAALFILLGPHECQGFPGESDPTFQQPPGVVVPSAGDLAQVLETIQPEYERCNEEIIDVHLHTAFWFDSAAPLLAEMDASYIDKGIMLAVYGPIADPFGGDPNEQVEAIVKESKGRIYGLASLNTTVDWDQKGDAELERLATFLAKPNFLGTKLAPPHTCMALDSDIMRDIVHTISISPSPLAFIHMGTTPFCGPFGAAILGRPGCCGPEYVDPSFMENLVKEYSNTTFVLVHAGADFLPPINEHYYNGENANKSISMAKTYDNVFLEISAFLRQENRTDVYPGGTAILQQIADAGLANKTFYGSDVNQAAGAMAPYLSGTVEKLIAAGFTDEERCMILGQNTLKVFGLEASTDADIQDEADGGEDLSGGDTSEDATSSAPTVSMIATFVFVAVSMASFVMI